MGWAQLVAAAREVNKAAIKVGDVKDFGGNLFVRVKKTDGKWGDYKKLGKKPEGWKAGDPLPAGMQKTADQAKKPAAEKPKEPAARKPKEPGGVTGVPSGGTGVTSPKAAGPAGELPPAPKEPKQAKEYMEKELGWGVRVHPANEAIVPFLAEFGRGYVQEFPFLKGYLNAIGDIAEVTAELGNPLGSGSGTLASVHYGPPFKPGLMGLGINFKNWGHDPKVWEKQLEIGVVSGFHPVGSGTLKATVDHEMGHVLTKALHTRDPVLKQLWESVGGKEKGGAEHDKCRKQLSAYAATNIGEFISEAWAEYRNNPKPRPLAKAVGDRYVEQLRRKHELIEKYLEDHVGPDLQTKFRRELWAQSLGEIEKLGGSG